MTLSMPKDSPKQKETIYFSRPFVFWPRKKKTVSFLLCDARRIFRMGIFLKEIDHGPDIIK